MFRFFKDFLLYGVTSVLAKIIAIFLMPVYTSVLTQEEYGAMALITSCKGIIDIISNLNIHSAVAREYYEENINRKRLVSTGFFSILSLSLFVLIVMLISNNFWSSTILDLPEQYSLAFCIMLCTLPAGSLFSYFSILTRFKKKPLLFSVGTLIQLLIQVSVSVVGVVVLRYGIVSVFVGVLLGELWGIIYFAYINRENIGFQYDFSYLKKALKYSIPTLPAILAGWIDSSVGQIFIGKYVSMADLGVYSIALSFASIFSLISIGLNNTWGPFLFENYKKEGFSQQVSNLFIVIVSGLIVVSVSVSLLSKELVLLFSNPSYIKASEYIALLCISMCIYLLFPIASSGIQILRDTKYIGIAYVVGSLFNILSLVILLPYWGIVTVPISLAFSRIVSYAIQYVVTRKNKILELPNQYVVVLILCSVLSYFIVCSSLSFWWRILIVVLFDGGMLFILNKRFSAIAKILAKIKRN